MADFPNARFDPPVISSYGRNALGPQFGSMNAAILVIGASGVWPSANLALYIPFRITSPYLVRLLWWVNGTTSNGNVDCGIFSAGGTTITTAGATAQGTVSVVQSVTLGTPVLLNPGNYYMGLASSSGTGTFFRISPTNGQGYLQACGCAQQATAEPLPTTAATFASVGQGYLPLFGIASSTVI